MSEEKKKDIPKIIVNSETKTREAYKEDLDNVFSKFSMGETPREFMEIRKKQILDHSNCDGIVKGLIGLTNMIGERDDVYYKAKIDTILDYLNTLHCPMVFKLPVHDEDDYTDCKLKEWDLNDLYSEYYMLCSLKGWEDYYTVQDKNSGFKNYQVIDMLNDLEIHGDLLSYYITSDVMGEKELMNTFDEDDSVINVVLKG